MTSVRRIPAQLSSVFSVAKDRGAIEGLRFASYRISEEYHERRLGIRTTGLWSPKDLGLASPESLEYVPAPYRALQYYLARATIRAGRDAFLDFGCGMGRALVVAATYRFGRVIGIELSAMLAERARENIRSARGWLRSEANVVGADARSFSIPDDVSLIFMYNPFRGSTLIDVINNIEISLLEYPREVTIIYGNPGFFDESIRGRDWIERVDHRRFYPRMGFALYRCRPHASED